MNGIGLIILLAIVSIGLKYINDNYICNCTDESQCGCY